MGILRMLYRLSCFKQRPMAHLLGHSDGACGHFGNVNITFPRESSVGELIAKRVQHAYRLSVGSSTTDELKKVYVLWLSCIQMETRTIHGKPHFRACLLNYMLTTSTRVRAEFDQIQDAITFEHENEAKSYVELFRSRSSFRRLFLAMSIQASVQMTGVSAIQYYSPEIFAQIGIPKDKTLQYQGISSIIALVAQFCCIMLIDWTGRRWTMIGGNLGNCVTFM